MTGQERLGRRGLAVAGRQLFAAPSVRKPYGASAAAQGSPATGRNPARRNDPSVARHEQDQAVVGVAPFAPVAGRKSTGAGPNAAHCPGRPLQPQRCFASALRADAPAARR